MSNAAARSRTEPTSAPVADAFDLRAHADEVFAQVSPYEGDGFRNHCRRLFHFATMLMEQRGIEMPLDVASTVAMWHDLGIVSEQDQGHNYLQRSRALFERETQGIDLQGTDASLLTECLLYNHRLLKVPGLHPVADCFRQAVKIEHARGMLRFGLPKDAVAKTFDALPRGNFDRVLLDFTWRTVRREPLSLVRGVFF